MDASDGAQKQTRWWFFGSAALAAHCAAVLLLPDMAPHTATAKPSQFTVWMTGPTDRSPALHDTPDHGSASVLSTPSRPAHDGLSTRHKPVLRPRYRRESAADEPTQNATLSQAIPSEHTPVPTQHDSEHRPEATGGSTAPASAAPTSASSSARGEPLEADSSERGVGGAFASHGDGLDGTARANGLRHGPGLLTASSPCRGFFPAQATVTSGAVQISVHVDATGHATLSRLLMELPLGQGFGPAARACAAALRFAPAVNREGIAVAGEARLELRFSRS